MVHRHAVWSYRPYQNLEQIDHNLHNHVFNDVIWKPPIAKDARQKKPGLSFDQKQKQLAGSKIKIDCKYISDNSDLNKQVFKNNMVHEFEVLCITSADNKLSIPDAVNYLTKAISGEETGKP